MANDFVWALVALGPALSLCTYDCFSIGCPMYDVMREDIGS